MEGRTSPSLFKVSYIYGGVLICMYKILTYAGTTVSQVSIQKSSIFTLRGTVDLKINCSITLSSPIGPDHSALNVTWLHNVSSVNMIENSLSTNQRENINFTSALSISSVEYTSSGNYCCVASVTGTTTTKFDCVNLTVSGLFDPTCRP